MFNTELDGAAEEGVFGYQPRYSQYKCRMDQVHGEFVDSLMTFTDYRQFAKTPVLNPLLYQSYLNLTHLIESSIMLILIIKKYMYICV